MSKRALAKMQEKEFAKPILSGLHFAVVITGDSHPPRTTEVEIHPSIRSVCALTNHSPPEEKIALFRSLFRGREDVYPRRFENRKTGKSGYSPACANEWVRGVCEKPRIKCSDCPHQHFLPVTDEMIRWHLSGRDSRGKDFVLGVYPMLLDETCFFLAVDFDGSDWKKDAGAFVQTCRERELSVTLERSRSGEGAHVWFFFEQALPASLTRKLGSHLLTETMEARPEVGLRSYDRLFPNQDTLPSGGFGNLIALPLQKQARERGNSVFLDELFSPYPDQWAFLSSVTRISKVQIEALVRDAESKERILGVRAATVDDDDEDSPWTLPPSRRHKELPINGPLPETLEVVIADQIYISKEELVPGLRNRLIRLAAFQNPEFYRAQAMRLPVYGKPRIISGAEDLPKHLAFPRGCLEQITTLLKELRIQPVIRDERFAGNPLSVSFCGSLRSEQQIAAESLLRHETGVLAATTAFGKTVIAAMLIGKRGVNTLVLVHRKQLLEQWVDRLSTFLNVPAKSIGQIGVGRKNLTGTLDIALIQSLARKGTVNDCVGGYGQMIIDECHHIPAHSFELVARRAKAKFVIGLSATVGRKDGHHPIIFMQCGPVRHRVDAKQQAAARPFSHQVFVRPTGFRYLGASQPDMRLEFHELYEELLHDERRNQMICADVLSTVREGRSPLVLTERVEQIEILAKLLSPGANLIVLHGGQSKTELKAAFARISGNQRDNHRVILATGKLVGEGFDDPRLDTLFLALPISWRGTVAQYVGRLHRLHEGKREVRVYDYADLNVPMLSRMFDKRCRGYESLGYAILLPASALPGWPVEVPLPIDPEWKRDYAASVRRLILDGVDVPLGQLFVHAARHPNPEAEGEARARSASEAFLYRRLRTLPATKDHFCLNVRLPIAFDGSGNMEVDFLCAKLGIVVELDGDQHLADADAYRRDRHKDVLLQQHGYFVLRFLACDVGKRLDHVLDSILAVIQRRTNSQRRP
jgi:superfamily II DNA or RNA helicase/very-short-patch-repair endonuclease